MNVPKLRFKEFNDEWTTVELSKISSDISYGMGLASKEYDGVNKYIRITDIDENTNKYSNKDIVSPDGELEDKYIVKQNDILFARTGASTGKTYLYDDNDGKLYFAGFLIRANIINHNANFIFQQTKTSKYNKWVRIMSMRSGQPGINSQEYGAYKFSITSLNEENKIANTLELLDKKIELQTKKIEALKLFKTGLFNIIQNLMCESEYLLKDIVTFGNGKGHENIVDENGNYVLINSKFISTEGAVIKKCTEQLCPLKENDIVMVMSDLPNGKALAKCFYVDENDKYSLNQRICLLRANNNINPQYLFYKINRNPYYLKFDDGVNQTNLKKEDILNLVINLPNIEYQNKYSQIMISIDKKIKNEKTSLTKLFKLKKGLMQNLFV